MKKNGPFKNLLSGHELKLTFKKSDIENEILGEDTV